MPPRLGPRHAGAAVEPQIPHNPLPTSLFRTRGVVKEAHDLVELVAPGASGIGRHPRGGVARSCSLGVGRQKAWRIHATKSWTKSCTPVTIPPEQYDDKNPSPPSLT